MASLNEIAYNIKNLAYNGNTNEEENIGIRQIKFWIHYHRARILEELVRNGKGVPHECLQKYVFINSDSPLRTSLPWTTWLASLSGYGPNDVVMFSEKTRILSALPVGSVPTTHIFGQDYYPEDRAGQSDELGYAILELPTLINISGYGVKNLQIRRKQSAVQQNTYTKFIPIQSQSNSLNQKYDRFGTKGIKAYISNEDVNQVSTNNNNEESLIIYNAQSVLRESDTTTETDTPIKYRIEADLLLANPTEGRLYDNDDKPYPFPTYLVGDLTRQVVQEMQIALQTQPDLVTDGMDTTRVQVQQKAQR